MTESDGGDEAAQAFEDLRGEVSLLRRAVERLTAERAGNGDAPDYSETLGVIANNITATARAVNALVNTPALALTPEEIDRQITASSVFSGIGVPRMNTSLLSINVCFQATGLAN